jgi:hypothetical protein
MDGLLSEVAKREAIEGASGAVVRGRDALAATGAVAE